MWFDYETDHFIQDISDRYRAMIMKLALQITRSPEDAEEVYNDVLMILQRNRSRILELEPDNARNYIYTITRNEALRKAHLEKKHQDRRVFLNAEDLPDAEGNPDMDALFRNEYGFSEGMFQALNELSVRDRELLCYYYGEGLNYSEIAEITGKSVCSLRTRMHRCRRKLHHHLRQ